MFVFLKFHRLILFERLLASYPYQQQRLQAEARKDIPPLYRAYAWAALLGCSVRLFFLVLMDFENAKMSSILFDFLGQCH